jgi:hypothetical protein
VSYAWADLSVRFIEVARSVQSARQVKLLQLPTNTLELESACETLFWETLGGHQVAPQDTGRSSFSMTLSWRCEPVNQC